ncbi:MAG: hypothetical protein ACRC6M_17985 [Microcystaceae cyanobacterium]
MTEPLTTGLLITLAVQEFVKSGTGDLAKRFTAEALAKIPVLGEKIKTQGNRTHILTKKKKCARWLRESHIVMMLKNKLANNRNK